MSVARVLVTAERDSNLPEDRIVNTLHYQGPGDFVLDADAQEIADDFLAAWTPWAASLFGVTLNGTFTVEVYDMAAPEPRVPIGSATASAVTVGANALPAELAVCVSFAGPSVSGQPQARRRGRIFLGPLPETAMAAAANGEVRVASTYRSNALSMLEAIDELALSSAATFELGVLSRTALLTPGTSVDEAFTVATTAWVDDAFDVQRRRGAAPTTRTTVAI